MAFRVRISEAASDALGHLRNGLGIILLLTLGGAVLNFVGQGIVAKILSPNELGQFGNALAIATFMAPVASLGMYGLWLRVSADEALRLGDWLKPSFVAIALATLLAMALVMAWGFIQHRDAVLLFLLLAWHIPARAGQELAGGVFQAERRLSKYAFIQFWPYLMRLPVLVICAVWWPLFSPTSRLTGFAIGHFVYSLIVVATCALPLVGFVQRHREKDHCNGPQQSVTIRDVIAGGAPFFGSSMLFTLYGQAGVIIAAQVAGFAEAAQYMVASLIASGGYLALGIMYQRYFQPRMFHLVTEAPDSYAAFVTRGFRRAAVLAAAIALGIGTCAWLAVVPFFGSRYEAAVPVLQLLGVAVGLRCLNSHSSSAFVRKDDLAFRTQSQFIVLLAIIPAMVIGAAYAGAKGIAAASIGYELLLLLRFMPRAKVAALRELAGGPDV